MITTTNTPDGVVYSYDANTGLFVGIELRQKAMDESSTQKIILSLRYHIDLFLSWAKQLSTVSGCEVVELQDKITFEMFWNKYNDKLRSSKKRSEKIWSKLDEANQAKAFYFITTYNKNRGNAEKKYCETYLTAELWNN